MGPARHGKASHQLTGPHGSSRSPGPELPSEAGRTESRSSGPREGDRGQTCQHHRPSGHPGRGAGSRAGQEDPPPRPPEVGGCSREKPGARRHSASAPLHPHRLRPLAPPAARPQGGWPRRRAPSPRMPWPGLSTLLGGNLLSESRLPLPIAVLREPLPAPPRAAEGAGGLRRPGVARNPRRGFHTELPHASPCVLLSGGAGPPSPTPRAGWSLRPLTPHVPNPRHLLTLRASL